MQSDYPTFGEPLASNTVVMGVAGCGKSSIGREISRLLGSRFIEGDDFHPPSSIELMRAGFALSDADRASWLHDLAKLLQEADRPTVLTCSALKLKYRELLRSASSDLRFIFLDIDLKNAQARLIKRTGSPFFNPKLIESQFETLERPDGEVGVLRLDATRPVPDLSAAAANWITTKRAA